MAGLLLSDPLDRDYYALVQLQCSVDGFFLLSQNTDKWCDKQAWAAERLPGIYSRRVSPKSFLCALSR